MPIYKKVNKNFFKKWSPEMAYVLGFFYADGNMVKTTRGGLYFSFYSSDKKLLVEIQELMNSKHKLSQRKSENVYRFQVGSKEMFNDLISLGCIQNKLYRMRVPQIPLRLEGHFIRGYFDGDGNVWSGTINKPRKTPTRILLVAFTSGSKEFLIDLKNTLIKNGCGSGSFFKVKNKNCYRASFSNTDSLKIYKIMYNGSHKPFLERKKAVFDRFIKNAVVV